MSEPRQIPLAVGVSEKDVSGNESLINVVPKKTDGGKYPFTLIGTPGTPFFLELPTYPVLQQFKSKGRSFAVTPTKLYEVFTDGTYAELGTVDLQGIRVNMESNGLQLVMVDGIKGFYYDFAGMTITEFSGGGWYPAATVSYLDGYFIFDRVDTGQFFISDLNSITLDPLNIATAEGQPDNLVACVVDHREAFMFGTDTIEFWYNSGDPDFPLERNQGAFVEKGCAARYTIAKQNNTIYFVGSDRRVYRMDGYWPVPISNKQVEATLNDVDLSDAFAYAYEEEGQLYYILTIPKSNVTWSYDTDLNQWSIRQSFQFGRHVGNCVSEFEGLTLIGDFQNGRIYDFSNKYYQDDQDPIVREFILPTVFSGRSFFDINSLELDMSSGIGTNIGQGKNPTALLSYSKDAGKTWSEWKEASIGMQGQYLTRVKWNRFGTGRSFDFKVRISDPIPIDIGGAWIETGR